MQPDREYGARLLAVVAALAAGEVAAGCAPSPVDLGADPDILWWTDHESGDLSDWQSRGSTWENAGGQLALITDPVRSGRHAVRSGIAPAPTGTISAAMAAASAQPADAYYSAWFYVPAPIDSVLYWVFFKLGAAAAGDPTTGVDLWDFDLSPTAPGELAIRMYRHDMNSGPTAARPVPIARWFHVEAHFRASTGDDGEIQLWQDDELLFEVHGPTAPTTSAIWTIGGAAEELTSPAATVFFDDAAVARRRLGSRFPPFWRAR